MRTLDNIYQVKPVLMENLSVVMSFVEYFLRIAEMWRTDTVQVAVSPALIIALKRGQGR